MNTKNLPMREFKADMDNRIITGYAAAFNNIDKAREVIEPGAFKKTLQESMNKIKTFYNHSVPIGKPISAVEDSYGLLTEARISKTQKGDEILELVRDGVISEMSIMYDVIKDDVNKASGVRHLRELKLYEFGPVDFACNDQAIITGVKNLADLLRSGKDLSDNSLAEIRQAIKILDDLVAGENTQEPQALIDTALVESIESFAGYIEEAIK